MTPTASVVVCTYNRADILRENIDSILNQDYPDYEVIYVDDGSTDDTAKILEDCAQAHPDRLKFVNTDRVGPARARNAGVAEAGGKVILFIDDDATAPSSWISGMVAALHDHDATLVCGGIDAYPTGDPCANYMHHRMQIALGPKSKPIKAGPTGNMIVRADAFRSVGGFRDDGLTMVEDWDLCLKLHRAGHRMYYVPVPSVVHRYHAKPEGVERRIRISSRSAVYIAKEHYSSVFAYVAYSVFRFVTSPFWVPRCYPGGIRAFALYMEWIACIERCRAYAQSFTRGGVQFEE